MSSVRNRRQTTTKNPLFLEYAKNEVNPHWRQFFENCAHGIFHKGISYKDGVIYHKKQKKTPTNLVITGDATVAAESIKKFIRNELGEISVDEMTKKRAALDLALKDNTLPRNVKWNEIRAPTVKQQMIVLFVANMRDALNLSDEQATSLMSVLNAGIASKLILSEDITIRDNKIVEIEGFDWDEDGFFLTRKMAQVPKMVRKPVQRSNGQMSLDTGWNKRVAEYSTFLGISVK